MGSAAPPARSGSSRNPHRWTFVGVVVLLVAALASVMLALQQKVPAASEGRPSVEPMPTSTASRPVATPTPSESPAPTPTPESTPEVQSLPARAAFIGDSYTQGGGADPDTARWTTVVATALGWVELNFGRGGTGFVTSNSYLGCGLEYCPTYVETVREVVAEAPDVVVVAGGQNDFDAFRNAGEAVRTAIWETYVGIRAGLPEAAIVAVGPSTPWGVDDVAVAFDAEVRAAAGAVGAVYVSMLDPDVIDPAFLLPDGHVNNDGHRAIAERVVGALTEDASEQPLSRPVSQPPTPPTPPSADPPWRRRSVAS